MFSFEVLEAIYNDPALWPKRNGVTPKKYGLSLQKKRSHHISIFQ